MSKFELPFDVAVQAGSIARCTKASCEMRTPIGRRRDWHVAMENLESGGRYSGKWSIRDDVLVTIWDSNGSKTTYDINSDGSFKSSHGILFVKTQ